MKLPKVDKIDLKKYENMEEFPKIKLIGGDDLIESTDNPSKLMDNIKKLYPDGYENLKRELESLRKQNKKDKTFLNIDDYFEKELKKPLFFNNSFFKKFVKKEGKKFSKTMLKVLFKQINKKFFNQIKIPSEEVKLDGERKRLGV